MIRIREAEPTDIPEITLILNQAIATSNSTAFINDVDISDRTEWFELHLKSGYPVFVAEESETEEMMGFLSLSPWRVGREALKHTAEVSYYVHNSHKRKGAATALMKHALDLCPDLGISRLIAILLDINSASISLLEKFGFEKWGHLPGVARLNGQQTGQFIYGTCLP